MASTWAFAVGQAKKRNRRQQSRCLISGVWITHARTHAGDHPNQLSAEDYVAELNIRRQATVAIKTNNRFTHATIVCILDDTSLPRYSPSR